MNTVIGGMTTTHKLTRSPVQPVAIRAMVTDCTPAALPFDHSLHDSVLKRFQWTLGNFLALGLMMCSNCATFLMAKFTVLVSMVV